MKDWRLKGSSWWAVIDCSQVSMMRSPSARAFSWNGLGTERAMFSSSSASETLHLLTHVQAAQQLMFGVSSNKMAFVLQVLGGRRGHVLIIRGGERTHCPKVREWCVGHKWQAGLMSECHCVGTDFPSLCGLTSFSYADVAQGCLGNHQPWNTARGGCVPISKVKWNYGCSSFLSETSLFHVNVNT